MSDLPKVCIAHPYYRTWEGEMGGCMEALAFRSAASVHAGLISCSGAYIEDNRNGLVKLALDSGIAWDWMLWVDTDMIFPADALLRLLADDPPERFNYTPEGWKRRKDIVGPNYRGRAPPYSFVAHYFDSMDTHLLEPGLWPMQHLPTGFLLTRFEMYRRMSYPWFKPGTHEEARDDVYFCRQARALGYEIWCDHDLTFEVRHIAKQEIPWFLPEQIKPHIEVRGAQLTRSKVTEAARHHEAAE